MTKNKKEEVIDEVQKAEGLEVDEIKTVDSTVETEQASEKIEEVAPAEETKNPEDENKTEIKTEQEAKPEEKSAKKSEVKAKSKFKVGDVVFVAKETSADLAGFKLFPQYKKYTYTIEAFDQETEVYTLRRLNLTLKLAEKDIVAPHERADHPITRKQF